VYETALGKRLISSRFSAADIARKAGIGRRAVSDYFLGRRNKAGKDNCRRIRAALIELGIAKPRRRKPPVCRNCGIIYPTRKGAPIAFRPLESHAEEHEAPR
jgi:hypothetical protein